MKRFIQSVIQRILGFDNYLFWFSRYKIRTLKYDSNEGDVIRFISDLPRDGVALDIGANIGIMTVLMARRLTGGTVHAFEPIPENFRALQRIVKHYGLDNVVLHHIALGETSGTLEMVMPEQENVRMQGLSHVVDPEAPDEPGERYSVPQLALDEVPELADAHITGIKIDVENHERFVFKGGLETIRRNRPLVYSELGQNENRTVAFKIFAELDYQVGVLQGDQVVPFEESVHDKHNFFLSPVELSAI